MKKSKLQAIIDFISQVQVLKSGKHTNAASPTKGNATKLRLLIAMFLCFHAIGQARTYYSRASGNWNVNSTWSTSGYGSPINLGTYPVAGDIVNIGNGYTINIASTSACAILNIGQGVSGILQYLSTGSYSLTVSSNLTINTGAIFYYNSAISRTHNLFLGGNFTNFGTVDFYYGSTQVVNLTFNTATNSNITGTGTWDLNNVTMAKTTSTGTQVNVTSNTFEAGIRNFIGTYGTYIHNNTSVYSINPTTSTFTIGPNVSFKVPLGIMRFASNADYLILQGSLYVSGGSVFVGKTNGLQGIRTDRNGSFVPYLEVTGGNLIVYGGITYNATSGSEPASFYMTGGNILLNNGTTGTSRQVFCINDVAGSNFVMSGGTITLQKPNVGSILNADFSICGINGTVNTTGGIVYFGNGVTASGATFNFKPCPNAVQPHFRISGQGGLPNTLATAYSTTANFKLLSLYIESGKTFDIRSIGGTAGDAKQMTLMSTANGVDALYNNGTFTARQSTVTFNTYGAQAIGGTATTTFYNLSINNSNHITLNRAANVSNYLSMVNGKLITTSTNILTCQSTAGASLGTSSSYVDGPMVHTVATSAMVSKTYPIGKGNSFRAAVLTVTHSNSTSVTYRAEVFNSAASSLPFGYPPTISNVSHVRYLRFARQAVSNFTSGRIQMYYDIDDVVADKNTLCVAEDDGSSMWTNLGGVATANWTGNILSGLFTTFNTYFALANPPGGGNPLPIELSAFTASVNRDNDVDVKWTTQSEINNDYFTVERSSDNETYSPIATINGSGNSTQIHNYSFTDKEPITGISYYRLVQTDFDGRTERFPASVVNIKSTGSMTVYPNPSTSGKINLSGGDKQLFQTITVMDLTGKVIPSVATVRENGTVDLEIDEIYSNKGGIFIVTATDGQRTVRQKLIIN